jgi:hypothetical protein
MGFYIYLVFEEIYRVVIFSGTSELTIKSSKYKALTCTMAGNFGYDDDPTGPWIPQKCYIL